MKKLIVFVCNGNIHRSVVAEKCLVKILRTKGLDRKFSVASYGLQGTKGIVKPLHRNLTEYPKEYKAALPTLRKFNIDVTNHVSQKITSTVVKRATVIIAMDKKVYSGAKNAFLKEFPKAKSKIYLFSDFNKKHKGVKDPFGSASFRLHQSIIEDIYFTIKDNVDTILTLAIS